MGASEHNRKGEEMSSIWDNFWFEDKDDYCSPGTCYICDADVEEEAGGEFARLMTLEAVKASA